MLLAAAVAGACTPGPGEDAYGARVAQSRAIKDESFRSSPDSPIPPDKKNTLLPLAYYPVDEALRCRRSWSCRRSLTAREIPTSTGKLRDYERIGTLRFSLHGQPLDSPLSAKSASRCRGCSCRSPTHERRGDLRRRAATWSSIRRPPASTSSTSTSPTTRSATTTRVRLPVPARGEPAADADPAPASGLAPRTRHAKAGAPRIRT